MSIQRDGSLVEVLEALKRHENQRIRDAVGNGLAKIEQAHSEANGEQEHFLRGFWCSLFIYDLFSQEWSKVAAAGKGYNVHRKE